MQTLKLNIQNKIEIVKDDANKDWSHLETEIQKGLDSGKSVKSHEDIVKNIKGKYVWR